MDIQYIRLKYKHLQNNNRMRNEQLVTIIIILLLQKWCNQNFIYTNTTTRRKHGNISNNRRLDRKTSLVNRHIRKSKIYNVRTINWQQSSIISNRKTNHKYKWRKNKRKTNMVNKHTKQRYKCILLVHRRWIIYNRIQRLYWTWSSKL